MLLGNFPRMFEKFEELYFELDGVGNVPGSALSDLTVFRRLELWSGSGSSSSEETGADVAMLPNGNSTSHCFGLVTKARAAESVNSSRHGMRRSSMAMSEGEIGLKKCFLTLTYIEFNLAK